MPTLHAPTLSFMLIVVAFTTGAMLLLSWLQNRRVASLAWWGAANLVAGLSLPFYALRGVAPDFVSIDIAGAVTAMAFSLTWAGFRCFRQRPVPLAGLFAPALGWMLLCQWDLFHASVAARVVVASSIAVGYALAAAWELARKPDERLMSRYPAIAWLMVHALFFGARIPLALITPPPPSNEIVASPWFAMIFFEALLNIIAMSFLQIAMIRERAENLYRRAALTDALTGAPNRRALLDEADRLLAAADGRPVCALLIDIDHFKKINDTFGHDGGDAALVGVADAMRAHLRPSDLFGRFGGEEFVCILPDTPLVAAMAVAEGLRARIAGLSMASSAVPMRISVSIGVASSADAGIGAIALLKEADRNLYEAKEAGRNRIAAGSARPLRPQLRIA